MKQGLTKRTPKKGKHNVYIYVGKMTIITPVWFDVGGKVWEFSVSLLARYPLTRLSKFYKLNAKNKALVTGNNGKLVCQFDFFGDEKEEFIPFIDGDPDRFEYVLDYMDQSSDVMFIPKTISKDDLLKDLNLYGFEDVNPSRILVQGQKVTNIEHLEDISAFENQLKTTLSKIKEQKYDNLEDNVEQMLDRVRKRKLQIENERDPDPGGKVGTNAGASSKEKVPD